MTEGSGKESLTTGPVLHVIVVGFHHKKGCQVEYSFPPLVEGAPYDSNECPPGWHYLPTLALPDGSHNFEEDTVYFHLPSLKNPKQTIFGVSCFRQIPVEKLTNRTSDITRGTVQKSVCVLSTLPLYGHIQVKMALITHAYFEEGDFSKVKLLQDTFTNLNSCLSPEMLDSSQAFVGLSLRELVLQFKHKALLLFKLLLLERKVLFFRSPVQQLCATILSLLSLHPGMLERGGLAQAACVRTSRPMSPMPRFDSELDEKTPPMSPVNGKTLADTTSTMTQSTTPTQQATSMHHSASQSSLGGRGFSSADGAEGGTASDISPGSLEETDAARANLSAVVALVNPEKCGLPLSIFTKGYLCHPYLSLPYMDMLSDVNVRGYVIGATNVLFKQKRQLADVLVEIEETRVETGDPDLRRQLHLTTEDLRFADYIVRHVAEERHDVFLDGVGWEGGDEWIRAQFRVYLLCLMRSCLLEEGSRELEHFNSSFVSAWRSTHNFKMWASGVHDAILEVPPGHPCAGQLSVADMKLRLSHTMQNTEGGRKVTQAMASTGRAVAHTGRAVGGAISQAKGAFSNWWSTLTTAQNPDMCESYEAAEEATFETYENAAPTNLITSIKPSSNQITSIKVSDNKAETIKSHEIIPKQSLSIHSVANMTLVNQAAPTATPTSISSNIQLTKALSQEKNNEISNSQPIHNKSLPNLTATNKTATTESVVKQPITASTQKIVATDDNKKMSSENTTEKFENISLKDNKEDSLKILPEIKKIDESSQVVCDEKVDIERTSLR